MKRVQIYEFLRGLLTIDKPLYLCYNSIRNRVLKGFLIPEESGPDG